MRRVSKLGGERLVDVGYLVRLDHDTTTDMHGLIVALVAASAAAQTCPASLISDKITTPLAGGTLYVSDGSDADFMNIVDLGDAAVRPRVGKTRLRTVLSRDRVRPQS